MRRFLYPFTFHHKIIVVWFCMFTAIHSAKAQVVFQAQTGASYGEHFSLGAGVGISKRHDISFLYGSNFFIKPTKFSSYLLQYNLMLHRAQVINVTPTIGIKGGNMIFTDAYYKWKLVAIIPFIGLHYPVNKQVTTFIQGGCMFSFEQSVKRIKDGEIGHYKDLLPEIKAGIVYNFLRKSHD